MVLDSSVMNVAISQIVDDLDTTIQGVQTAITLYTLVMAAFMLLGAKLGDILGRNRAFAIGLAIYGVGSLTTALSPNLAVLLIGWSGVEGFGAVLVVPAIAALTAASYEGKERALAYALLGGIAAIAVAAGPLIGGWVDDGVLVALRVRRRDGRRDRDPAPARADRPRARGRAAPAARRRGRGALRRPASAWSCSRSCAAASGASSSRATPPDDQRHGDHAAGLLARAVPGPRRASRCCGRSSPGSSAAPASARTSCSTRRCCASRSCAPGSRRCVGQQLVLMGTFFVIPVYLQVVLGLDAFETGKRLLPLSVAMLVFALLGPRMAARRSPRTVAQVGLVAVSIGAVVMLATLDVELNDTGFKLALALVGAGAGLLASQLGNVIMSSRRARPRPARRAASRARPRTSAPRSARRSSARCCSRRWRPASASASPTTPTSRRPRARRSSPRPRRGSTSCRSTTSRRRRVEGGLTAGPGQRGRRRLRRRAARRAAAGARRGRARGAAVAVVHPAAADDLAGREPGGGTRLIRRERLSSRSCTRPTTAAPSPTAVAQRLIEPERTSPAA